MKGIVLVVTLLCSLTGFGQTTSQGIDINKITSFCLDADVKSALALVRQAKTAELTENQAKFVKKFEDRFGEGEDKSGYMAARTSPIDPLFKIYEGYWRKSLLDPGSDYSDYLKKELTAFLSVPEDSLNSSIRKYVESFGYHTTSFGKTGKLFDLLVWKTETDTVYKFKVHKERISAPVVFMDNFVTLGWEEYATLDRAFPGGWAKTDALYCVKKAYKLDSESFLISYLCHEARHFSDYKLFPKLKSPDLEYRGKLTELSMLEGNLFPTLKFFIDNSNRESKNGHAMANFYVVSDLSKAIFQQEFVNDIERWKKVEMDVLHENSRKVLEANTKALKKLGKNVESLLMKPTDNKAAMTKAQGPSGT